MTETMSLSTRKTAVLAQIAQLQESGATPVVVVNSRAFGSLPVLAGAVENFTSRELDELQPQLEREEDRIVEQERRDQARADREAEYSGPNPLADVERERQDAVIAAVNYARTDSARLDRIAELLERAVVALEKR